MTDKLYQGPWRVVDRDTLGHTMRIGDVMKHKSGAVILKCPKCRALQFAYSPVTGTDDKPTLTRSIQCGGGHCKRCGIWFRVDAGETVLSDAAKSEPRPIPERLKRGMKTPPKLPPEHQ